VKEWRENENGRVSGKGEWRWGGGKGEGRNETRRTLL